MTSTILALLDLLSQAEKCFFFAIFKDMLFSSVIDPISNMGFLVLQWWFASSVRSLVLLVH